jgi:hypothetical protein
MLRSRTIKLHHHAAQPDNQTWDLSMHPQMSPSLVGEPGTLPKRQSSSLHSFLKALTMRSCAPGHFNSLVPMGNDLWAVCTDQTPIPCDDSSLFAIQADETPFFSLEWIFDQSSGLRPHCFHFLTCWMHMTMRRRWTLVMHGKLASWSRNWKNSSLMAGAPDDPPRLMASKPPFGSNFNKAT